MKSTSQSPMPTTKVLVLDGHADPCGNKGTEGRFSLLPIPWPETEFQAQVQRLIEWELSNLDNPPNSTIGVDAWIVSDHDATVLNRLMTHKNLWGKTWNRSAQLIDELSFHKTPITFLWPNQDSANQDAIRNLNLFLEANKG